MTGFSMMAEAYDTHGAAVVPCDNAKRPIVRWAKMTKRTTGRLLPRWREQYPDANIGLLTGPSRLTVVDIDSTDNRIVRECLKRFGETSLMAKTPSGGTHLVYRSGGEPTRARLDGEPVDIRGVGGFLVVPPSERLDGRRYEFTRGGIEDLEHLPACKSGALGARSFPLSGRIAEGRRNDTLFRLAMMEAHDCITIDELEARVLIHNEACQPFLGYEEVKIIVSSAWRYEQCGQNWVGKGGRVFLEVAELEQLTKNPDAAVLLLALRKSHLGLKEFAISPAGLASKGQFVGWSKQRIRNAREFLIGIGALAVKYEGGRGKHDPSLFSFPHRGE
jgi:hypothetical protein